MSNIKKKPNYNSSEIQRQMIELVTDLYKTSKEKSVRKQKNTLLPVAEELGISISKVIKLLITGGAYMPAMAKRVNILYESGLTVPEIQTKLGVSRTTVQTYLPYKKGIYSAKETSVNADRIRIYRERCKCLEVLQDELTEEALWEAIVLFQEYPFYTSSGVRFSYVLNAGADDTLDKELVVSSRDVSETLAWSSVRMAFDKALQMQGRVVDNPEKLGIAREIEYIYPVLYRFGIIEVPEDMAENMRLKGGAGKRSVDKSSRIP